MSQPWSSDSSDHFRTLIMIWVSLWSINQNVRQSPLVSVSPDRQKDPERLVSAWLTLMLLTCKRWKWICVLIHIIRSESSLPSAGTKQTNTFYFLISFQSPQVFSCDPSDYPQETLNMYRANSCSSLRWRGGVWSVSGDFCRPLWFNGRLPVKSLNVCAESEQQGALTAHISLPAHSDRWPQCACPELLNPAIQCSAVSLAADRV